MGPLPKKKTSQSRQGQRRSHLHMTAVRLVDCPQCHSPRLPHRVCPTCGTYNGREVISVETKPKKSA